MTLHELNILPQSQLKEELLKCCGSVSWARMMLAYFPADDLVELLEYAEEVWYQCSPDDWKEAFAQHPKIGDLGSITKKFASTTDPIAIGWAAGEQSGVNTASTAIIEALAESNRLYEEKFGYIFIVCATGKSAEEMLGLLQLRLRNNPEEEILLAADEQNAITKLRIEKLVQ
ncbi:MAG: 2-oxo-4-hydroxy-4-carboxy-5-ureidoimidazoline decarboxylase [Bacteroidota bacterium]|nr:2-oxo-4-hydroxy-4-carboxy-5-ureidoimidazoline decarboxylase [Bacteroidota bacterium]